MTQKLVCGLAVLLSLIGVLTVFNWYQHLAKAAQTGGELKKARDFKDSLFRVDNIDTLRIYTQPVSLQFYNKPLLRIGQPLASLPTALDYHRDEMSDIGGQPYLRCYTSLDSYYSVGNNYGPNGTLWFMTDRQGRIIALDGVWVVNVFTKKQRAMAAQKMEKWFPALRRQLDFEHPKKVVLEGADFKEIVEMTPATDTAWGALNYRVELKPHSNNLRSIEDAGE